MAYDAAEFEARRRGLMENFGATSAMRTYSNTLSQQRGNRALANYGYGLENKQAQAGYNYSVQDLEAEKSRQIAQDAQDILRYRAGAYA